MDRIIKWGLSERDSRSSWVELGCKEYLYFNFEISTKHNLYIASLQFPKCLKTICIQTTTRLQRDRLEDLMLITYESDIDINNENIIDLFSN